MQLRPYQLEGVEAVWNELFKSGAALCVMPTGSGKTEMMMELLKKAREAKSDLKSTVMMGRIDLVRQTDRRFRNFFQARDIGVFCGSLGRKETTYPITIVSIQSADTKQFPMIHLIIVDEVHRVDQASGGYKQFIDWAINLNPRCKIVGFTATPFRADGFIYGEKQLFKKICFRKTLQEIIALGHLVPPILKASKNEFDTSQLRMRGGDYRQEDVDKLVADQDRCQAQVEDAVSRLEGRQCVAWATANIEHCNMVADKIMAMGERVTTIHSKLGKGAREANLSAFVGGSARHMVFVTILSEGWDHPPTDAIVLMRPTRSPILYVQTVGRGLRPYENKKDCLVLDYGQVISTLGPLDEPNISGKTSIDPKTLKPVSGKLKCCPACLTFSPAGTKSCPECSYEWPYEAPEEKLNKKAAENAMILSEKAAPKKEILGPAVLSMYESKNGNLCVKVHYKDPDALFNDWFSGKAEFFVTSNAWAMQRLERRLEDLNCDLPSVPFDGEITALGSFEVLSTKDGKYDRLIAVKKISEALPEKRQLSLLGGIDARTTGLDAGSGN